MNDTAVSNRRIYTTTNANGIICPFMDSLMNQKFILAIAKELEYKRNTSDAALLLAKLNGGLHPYWSCDGSVVCWKNRKKHAFNFADYYVDYFAYIDGE